MSFQYTYDTNGNPVGAFVPIKEWNKLSGDPKARKNSIKSLSPKEKTLQRVEKGMKQVASIKKGKFKSVSLKQLLDAL